MSLFLKKSFLELKADIHDGALHSKDLIEETLKLIEKDNDPFKAFVNWDPDRVEQNASTGILQGYPIGIKDILFLQNIKSSKYNFVPKSFGISSIILLFIYKPTMYCNSINSLGNTVILFPFNHNFSKFISFLISLGIIVIILSLNISIFKLI